MKIVKMTKLLLQYDPCNIQPVMAEEREELVLKLIKMLVMKTGIILRTLELSVRIIVAVSILTEHCRKCQSSHYLKS